MEPPLILTAPARAFWDRHYPRLRAAGLMTDADADSFALLCVCWGKLAHLTANESDEGFRNGVQLNQLLKQFQLYAREFGLFPRDRQRSKLNTEPAAPKDEFDL